MQRPLSIFSRRLTHPCRRYLHSKPDLIKKLLLNPELSQADASNELRWITQHVSSQSFPSASHSSPAPSRSSLDDEINSLVERRAKGEPLQYILGTTDFGPLELLCRPPVLIPRPETAHTVTRLAENILQQASLRSEKEKGKGKGKRKLRILDLCTGSGCIPLLLSHLLTTTSKVEVEILGVDISKQAIQVANDNLNYVSQGFSQTVANRNKPGSITFRQLDIFSPDLFASPVLGLGKDKFDLVISNPPYIPLEEWKTLPSSVREFEDPLALIGDSPSPSPSEASGVGLGLGFYKRIGEVLGSLVELKGTEEGERWREIPVVAVEIGHGQAEQVQKIFREVQGVGKTQAWKDQYGVDRMVVGWAK